MAQAHTKVTGAVYDSTIDGPTIPQRRNIRDLINDRVSFSIYIQALGRMYATNQNDDLSYYQISGIHGLPYKAWQGSGGTSPAANTGYCTHSNVLFPTWHRPYLALYEQILCKLAVDITEAANMPPAWKQAARALRQPYWDWASGLTPPAEVLQLRQISILQPDGSNRTVDNPLFSYKFADTASSFANVNETFRRPSNLTLTHGRQLARQTYDLLTRVNDWFGFSTNAAGGDSISSSLESIHDDIHGTIGGMMGSVPYSAFDPIFWLHHCNVDRIFAFWQVLHPNVWVTPSNMGASRTRTIPANATVNASTPLTPFWDGPGSNDYWQSSEVQTLSRFGYTYPELATIASASNPQVNLLRIVTNLYGGGTIRNLSRIAERLRLRNNLFPEVLRPVVQGPLNLASSMPNVNAALTEDMLKGPAQIALSALTPALAVQSFIAKPQALPELENKQTVLAAPPGDDGPLALIDWSARVRVEKYALNESFQVCIFLVPEGIENATISETDSKDWYESPYFVGQFCAFVNGTHQDMCQNCVDQKEKHVLIEGHVPLDEAIIEISGLKSFDDEVVHPYLTKNMVWRCKKADGTVVPMEKIPSLEVSVWSTTLKVNPGDTESLLPDWTAPHCHKGITAGQPGGCKNEAGHTHGSAAAA